MKKLILILCLFICACSPNYWRCHYKNPANMDAQTLEFCKSTVVYN